ncbi:MAG: phosphoenolpyruvate--protein phosphotransferase [Chloroflexi bacterium]|nr:phosphoenolpyruvate--protein phosphotransferase [Chloroflexota bacterium]
MVGLVIASHSRALAEAIVDLVRQIAPVGTGIAIAAGVGEDRREFGTDALEICDAIQSVYSSDGVVVLMDLGSAVLSADMALELLPVHMRTNVRLCAGPLIEGAIAAAVQAGLGKAMDTVCDEAQEALKPKTQHLSASAPADAGHDADAPWAQDTAPADLPLDPSVHRAIITLINPHGLHARPAAHFVQTAANFDARVTVRKLGSPGDPVSGKSLNKLATLGATERDQIEILAEGPQAAQAVDALRHLVESGFGEREPQPAAPVDQPPARLWADSHSQGTRIAATPVSEGIGIGPLYFLRAQTAAANISDDTIIDTGAEWQRLSRAIDATRRAIQQRRQQVEINLGAAQAAIFDAHALILQDEALLDRARQLVEGDHHNAMKAWHLATDEIAGAYRRLPDGYMQQRAHDVMDVAGQVLDTLGQETTQASHAAGDRLPGPVILVGRDFTPTQIAQLELDKVLGIITTAGSANSHAAILTRALGIPGVAGAGAGVEAIPEGTLLAVDGFDGCVWVSPTSQTLQELAARRTAWLHRQQQLRQSSHTLTVTRDGHRIEVAANLGGLVDAPAAIKNGAEAIGVLRTEFLYLTRKTPPSEDEQVAPLRQVAEQMNGRPVIVRTLDVGGDKAIPYLPLPPEANPFLGVRAIRLSLQQPELFLTQIRAILRAGAGYDVRLLLPMVTLVEEIEQARHLIDRAHESLSSAGIAHRWPMPVGIMVETPAAALHARVLAQRVDFFSIGTNDLTQYTLAAERGNPSLVQYGDALHPVILRLIHEVVTAAHDHGKWAGVCGEVASDPLAVPILAGLDIDELSLNAAAIPQVKAVIRALELPPAQRLARAALQASTANEVRQMARAFAAPHDPSTAGTLAPD